MNIEEFSRLCWHGTPQQIKAAINTGADFNRLDLLGWTALMDAAWRSRPEIVDVLLEAGADATLENNAGYRAIDIIKFNCYEHYSETIPEYKDTLQRLREASL